MAGRVARYQADRTNQKMYFCRIYCQQAEQTQKGQLQEAHIESALMHLYGGYLAFLQEVARYYNLTMPNPSLQSISDDSKPPQAVTQKRPEEQASVPMPTTGNNINYAQLNSNKPLNE